MVSLRVVIVSSVSSIVASEHMDAFRVVAGVLRVMGVVWLQWHAMTLCLMGCIGFRSCMLHCRTVTLISSLSYVARWSMSSESHFW